jgi:predicted lipoprotein with Yx(FWY)xxD motif
MRTARNAVLCSLAFACLAACGTSQAAATAPAWEVKASTLPGAGRVLADGPGFTLYVYIPDHRGRSQCSGVCARDWPPLVLLPGVRHATAGSGVQASLLGTVRRPGGALQVTYNRWPLYLWHGDHVPGQAAGQADDMGLWYVLSVSGSVDKLPVQGQAGS